jgi:hypothetical protein
VWVGSISITTIATTRSGTHVGAAEEGEELAAGDKVHDHIEVGRILEAAPEVDDNWVLHALKHVLLVVRVRDLLESHDLLLAQDLDRIVPEVVLAPYCGVVGAWMGERVQSGGGRDTPRWTRPKLPVPSVRSIRKSESL